MFEGLILATITFCDKIDGTYEVYEEWVLDVQEGYDLITELLETDFKGYVLKDVQFELY